MHSLNPRTTPVVPSTSKHTWKRGRPVTSRRSTPIPLQQKMSGHKPEFLGDPMQSGPGASLASQDIPPFQDQSIRVSNMDGAGGRHIWDLSKLIIFMPTEPSKATGGLTMATHHGTRSGPIVKLQAQSSRFSTATRFVQSNNDPEHAMCPTEDDRRLLLGENERLTSERASSGSEYMADKEDDYILESDNMTGATGCVSTQRYDTFTWHIPNDILRTAMLAPPNTRASYWSASLYRGPDDERLLVHYCQTFTVAERVARYFLREKVVGFDIEWKPRANQSSIKQNASLIQLACENRIALFHISQFSGTTAEQLLPPSLKSVLESPDILKVGVAVKSDFKRLTNHLNIHARCVFEVSRLHNLVEWYETDPTKITKKLVGLATQVHRHLLLPLYKGGPLVDEPENTSSVRESDWSMPLNKEQIRYAADDAYAGFRLYHVLESKRMHLKPVPPAIQVCDYDSLPTSRNKNIPKKSQSADINQCATQYGQPLDKTLHEQESEDRVVEEQEEADEENEYETTPEDISINQRVEPLQTPRSIVQRQASHNGENNTSISHIGIEPSIPAGRATLSWLQSCDPAYPILPLPHTKTDEAPDSWDGSEPSSSHNVENLAIDGASKVRYLEHGYTPQDEDFADSELEEALRHLDFDDSGILRSKPIIPHIGERSSSQEQAIERSLVAPDSQTVTDLSDFNTQDLDTQATSLAKSPIFKPSTFTVKKKSYSSDYNLATTWAQEYLQRTTPPVNSTAPSHIRATVTHLRAYHLWYYQKLSLEEIGRHLREPPLSTNAVASHILQAITLEKLAYEQNTLKAAMLEMPSSVRNGRWKWMAGKVGAL